METLKPTLDLEESNGFSQPPPITAEDLMHLPRVVEVAGDFTRHDSFEEIANSLKFEACRFDSLNDLFCFLLYSKRAPAMVVLDHDTTLQGNRMEDTMAAVKTLLRSRDPEPSMPRFAVRVTQPVDRNTVRNFKALGIQGLIPANTQGNFNFYLKLKAYEEILVRNAEYWPSECIKKNAEPRRGRSQDACGIQLTERQQQVQKLLCERGLSNKAIARHLNISESTVKIHVSAILKRYAVRNRTQLALAVKNHARL